MLDGIHTNIPNFTNSTEIDGGSTLSCLGLRCFWYLTFWFNRIVMKLESRIQILKTLGGLYIAAFQCLISEEKEFCWEWSSWFFQWQSWCSCGRYICPGKHKCLADTCQITCQVSVVFCRHELVPQGPEALILPFCGSVGLALQLISTQHRAQPRISVVSCYRDILSWSPCSKWPGSGCSPLRKGCNLRRILWIEEVLTSPWMSAYFRYPWVGGFPFEWVQAHFVQETVFPEV